MKNFNRYLKAIKIIQMKNFKLKNTIHLRTQKVILIGWMQFKRKINELENWLVDNLV